MAISRVGDTSGYFANGVAISQALPTGMAQGDIVYAITGRNNNTALTITSSGWTQVAAVGSAGNNGRLEVWRKVMGSSPDTTIDFSDTVQPRTCITIALRVVDTTTPEDATPTTAIITGAASFPNSPSITTATNGALVIAAFTNPANDAVFTNPTGYTDQVAIAGANRTSGLSIKTVATAGAEDPGAWAGIQKASCNVTIAVRPSSARVLVTDAGSIAVTGSAATLKWGHKLVAGAGSVAVTGQAATLKWGHKLIAGAGAISVTGQAALLKWTRAPLVAGPGSIAITGQAVTLKYVRKLIAEAGSIAVTGQPASFVHHFKLTAGTGSVAVTGQNLTFNYARKLQAGAGSYAVTGFDIAFITQANKVLSADPGAIEVTGQAATFRWDHKFRLDAGSIAINGQPVTLKHGWKLAGGAGSYSVIGRPIDLLWDQRLDQGAGTILVTGQDLTFHYARRIILDPGSIVVTGKEAFLTYSPFVPPPIPGGNSRNEAQISRMLRARRKRLQELEDAIAKGKQAEEHLRALAIRYRKEGIDFEELAADWFAMNTRAALEVEEDEAIDTLLLSM
ncbi:MAG: hypothetical protein AB7O44_30375 [Hyphomicrobiaceae bacterium]